MNLLEKYKPVLVLDKHEEFFPGSIKDYIDMSYFKSPDGKSHNVSDNYEFFKKISKSENNGKGYSIIIKDSHLKNFKTRDKEKNYGKKKITVPVYCHILEKEDRKQLFYIFFYNFNGPKKVLNLFPVGDHLADIEMVIVELKNEIPEKVFLSQHTSGEWRDFDDMYRIKDRIIVFSAVNSHAHYAEPGKYIRILGFGNDNCSKGTEVDPDIQNLREGNPLYDYKGFFGKSIKSFRSRFYWH